MIPSPKLDDRTFEDIVEEAIALIPRYAPDWTNHNPSDPGITLIELAAWMTDLILYRLNRVPEKNYVAFLNLLGIKLKAPRAARALLQFALVEGANRQKVPRGTRVATPQAAEEETITFETVRDLVISSVKLDRCFSYFNETYSDNSAFVAGERDGEFEVFGGAERVDRYLYLSDPRFANAGDASLLRIFLGCPERGGRDLARLLEWQYWNGDRWREMEPALLEVDRGEVCFLGPLAFAETEVNDIPGLWVRGRLAEIPDRPEDTEIDTVRARVEVVGEGVVPDKAVSNLDSGAYISVDIGKNSYPFGKEPKVDCVFYLACDELLRTPGAEIAMEFTMADPAAIPKANPSDGLILAWEYFDGKRWRLMGRSSPRGNLPGSGQDFAFHDGTKALSQTGVVSFRRPTDLVEHDLNGEVHNWVRVRIEKGDYGQSGSYTLENEKWVFVDQRPLQPPAVRQIAFRYREDYRDVRFAVVFNDFAYTDVTEDARTDFTIFQPFTPKADESPSLYLGFEHKLPNEALSVYFQMVEELGLSSLPEDAAAVSVNELVLHNAARAAAWESEQRVIWEYFDGSDWQPLAVNDGTSGFTTSGFVDFVGPDDWQKSMKFTEERFWFRARLEMGGYPRAPRIRRVLTNVVEAHNQTTVRSEILGSSNATPLQTMKLLLGPLLEGEIIEVLERQRPAADDIEDLGADAVTEVEDAETDACWVRWRRVESFFESGPRSRHYMLDYQTGVISFGDGAKGMIPSEGQNNVRASSYRIGGGAAGNVNAGTLTSLTRAIAYIETVNNPLAATGGADRESVAEAKERAPYTIKSRDRAVTAEDFEMLALRASTTLARAKCVPDRGHRGAVTLVVVPKAETGNEDMIKRLIPSNEVLRYVKRYLDDRRLVGTILNVTKPRYDDFSLKVTLLRRTVGTSDRLRRDIDDKLRRYLHPLLGGRDGKGWEFGRPVLKTELIHVVEEIPGVEGVDALEIRDETRGALVEHVRIDPDELPHLVHVHVVEKVRDEIM